MNSKLKRKLKLLVYLAVSALLGIAYEGNITDAVSVMLG